MACTIDTYALTDIDSVKQHIGLTSEDLKDDAITIYNAASGATAATVEVTATTIVLIVTGGASAGTSTLTFADSDKDTIGELVAAIEALNKGWVVERSCDSDVSSTNLSVMSATSSIGSGNAVTLTYLNNELLCELINQASDIIETIADRQFKSKTRVEKFHPTQSGEVVVKHWPIIEVLRVHESRRNGISVTNANSTAISALVRVSEDNTDLDLQIVGGAHAGTDTISLTSYTTLTAVVAQINTLSAKGWSASVQSGLGNMPSSYLLDVGGSECLEKTIYLEVPDEALSNYKVYKDRGMIMNCWSDHDEIIVEYTGGYSTIPDDIKWLANEIVKSVYEARKRDNSLKRERLGDYEYEIASNVVMQNKSLINTYRNWNV